jgi:Catalase
MTAATDWKEVIAPGEEARLLELAERLHAIQRKVAVGERPGRALHAKGQAGVDAEFEVLPDLPEVARQGLFATPAKYAAYVRFSNGGPVRQRDGKPDVRGLAVKVLGVEGKKIIPGLEGARTQDFLLIRSPAAPFRDAYEFVSVVTAAMQPLTLLPRVIARLGAGRTLGLVPKLVKQLGAPVASLATTRYFSALPVQYGPYAVHYALVPGATPDGAGASPGHSPEYLGEELAARLRRGPVVYDFRVQFYVDEVRTPIEDASVEWREQDAPFVTVARLTLLAQDPDSERGRRLAQYVEKLSFDPWHALEAHRPLGNMMRARNVAYRLSTQERGALPEPDGAGRFE